jgi:hypothetical protein
VALVFVSPLGESPLMSQGLALTATHPHTLLQILNVVHVSTPPAPALALSPNISSTISDAMARLGSPTAQLRHLS